MYSVGLVALTTMRESPLKDRFSSWLVEVTESRRGTYNPGYDQGPNSYILDRAVEKYTWACSRLALSLINIRPSGL